MFIHSSLVFAGKAGNYLSGEPYWFAPPLLASIKTLLQANTLAYFARDEDKKKVLQRRRRQSCRVVGVDDATKKPWDCRHHLTCEDGEEILFAWARRAPPTEMPHDVTFKVDPAQTPYLVLQVHYAHKMDQPDSSAISVEYQTEP
jgi:Copper type II ascorbate-dependent monooxygenase, N-terminal domain